MRGTAQLALVLLAACGSPEQAPVPHASAGAVTPSPKPTPAQPVPSPAQTPRPAPMGDLATLESRDCRTVAQAYFTALAAGDYAQAARVWDDPAIGKARLKALFSAYKRPTVAIADLQQEGAAGSSYCTVSGTLNDAGDAARPPQKGEIVLKRVNDVPGATPAQLRWTIRSSTFVENMARSG